MPFDLARRLIAAKIVAPEAMAAALKAALLRGVTVARALVDEGVVTEIELEVELERHCGPLLTSVELAEDRALELPQGMCRRLGAVPAVIAGAPDDGIDVACVDPLDPHVAPQMEARLAVPVRLRRATDAAVEAALVALDALHAGVAELEGAGPKVAPSRPSFDALPVPELPRPPELPRSGMPPFGAARPAPPEAAPPTARSSVAPPPPSPPAEAEVEPIAAAIDALREASARDEILVRTLSCLARVARRAGVFAVRSDGFRGLVCTESLAVPDVFRTLVVGRGDASVFTTALAVGVYLGPIPATSPHADLLRVAGPLRGDVAVAAVDVAGRPAMILLADDLGDVVAGTRALDAIARAAGHALAVCMRVRGTREGSGAFRMPTEGPRSDLLPPSRRSQTPASPGSEAPRRVSELPPVPPVVPARAPLGAPSPLPGAAGARARIPTPKAPHGPDEPAPHVPTPLLPFGPPARAEAEPRPPDRSFTPLPGPSAARRSPSGSMPALAGLTGLTRPRTSRPPVPASASLSSPSSSPAPRPSRPVALVWEPTRPGDATRPRTQPPGLGVPQEPEPFAPRTSPPGPIAEPTTRARADAPPDRARARTHPNGLPLPQELEAPRGRTQPSVAPPPAEPVRTRTQPAGIAVTAPLEPSRTRPPPVVEVTQARPSAPPPAPDPALRRTSPPVRPSPSDASNAAALAAGEHAPDEFAHAVVDAAPPARASVTPPPPRTAPPPRVEARPRYEVLGPLAVATTGEVVVARDDRLGRNVAYKRLPSELASVPELVARLRREARMVASLEHPSIAPVHELVADGDTVAYAMRLGEGRPLSKVLAEARADVERLGGVVDERKLSARLEVFLAVCDAVGFAHGKRVVHRDLEPRHVLVGAHHDVLVLGWDHARVVGEPDPASRGASVAPPPSGASPVVGNLAYVAPEQAERRDADVDARSDVFALGLLLQEIATLQPARVADDDEGLLAAARAGDRVPMARLASGEPAPRALAALVAKAAAPRRQDRYPSAASLAADVRAFLAGEPVSAHEEGGLERLGRLAARRAPMILRLGLVGAIVTLASVGALAARELQHAAARERDAQRTSALVLGAAEQGRVLDACFHRARAEAAVLAARAADALDGPDLGPLRTYASRDFDEPARAPSDLLPSRSYGGSVSLAHASIHVADGAGPDAAADLVTRLGHLRGALERAVVDGAGLVTPPPAGELRRLILDQGVPLQRARVALESGVAIAWPGMGAASFGGELAARAEAAAEKARGARFVGPLRDHPGPGLVEVAVASVLDARGARRGVATVEVALDWVRAVALAPTSPWVSETLLLDEGGAVVLRRARGTEAASSAPAPAEVRAALASRHAARVGFEAGGARKVAALCPLDSIGWTFVAIADDVAPEAD
jgi:serine/threonine-protein kinase